MKQILTLALPLYLSCAAPQVEKPSPKVVIVDIGSANPMSPEEDLPPTTREPPFKQVLYELTDHFEQILRQQKKRSLEGMLYLENSNDSFSYNYDKGMFCNPDAKTAYFGKITIQYNSSQTVKDKYQAILTTLTDVPPFGSVDKVELFTTGTVRTSFYANYEVSPEAEKLYERLLRQLYAELQLHSQNNASWENFALDRITKDERWETYKLQQDLLKKLLSQEQLPFEKIQFFNPCEQS